MNRQPPDIEQLERCLKAIPASFEGPDAQRLESILHRTKAAKPKKRAPLRLGHRYWWVFLALATGMATAAIWHQVRKMRVEPGQAVLINQAPAPKQEAIPHSVPSQPGEGENPLSRPDRRFIPN